MIPVKIKNIGIGAPKICMPLIAETKEELFSSAEEALILKPDIVEIRADYYKDLNALPEVLADIRKKLSDTPLLFTCRDASEGGAVRLPQEIREELILRAVEFVDIVDIELAFAGRLIERVKARDVAVVLSRHFFDRTPPRSEMLEILRQEHGMGADIAKLAVTPNSPSDVLELLHATEDARSLGIPIITISMGPLGLATRVIGGVFGSAVTFGAGSKASAPGQLHVSELRAAMAHFYKQAHRL